MNYGVPNQRFARGSENYRKTRQRHMKPDAEYQRRLERENRQIEKEVEFLKKQQHTLPGTRGKVSDDKK